MRSIFRDYCIGSLLLWKGKDENLEALSCQPIYAFAGGDGHRTDIVLDGQQRLTAMYYAFIASNKPAPWKSTSGITQLAILISRRQWSLAPHSSTELFRARAEMPL